MKENSIICLMGPTASGKTDLAIALSECFPVEIISVDSSMVYRGMNIGAAKPSPEILKKYPHHLIDIRDPSENYSAADFCDDALKLIQEIIAKYKTPLLVGGTMMYFRALQQGLSPLPTTDAKTREKINREIEKYGLKKMHQRLQQIDPISAQKIHPNDPQRLQRALEIYEITGKSRTELSTHTENYLKDYHVINIAITPSDRNILRERIRKRFYHMLELGFIDEVKQLPPMRAVGYRQAADYLNGKLTYDEMVEKAIIATQQLAKRQLTWLRSWPNLQWFDSEATSLVEDVVTYLA